MAASLEELEIRLTGGAGNSVVANSTGGVVSSTRVYPQAGSGLTTLDGVVINGGFGNDVGDGTLSYDAATKALTWTPYNGTTGDAIDVSADGDYFIQANNSGGALAVTVTAASLPTENVSNTVAVVNNTNGMFNDITKDQSYDGRTVYHCFGIVNAGLDTKKDVKIYMSENSPGQDSFAIAVGAGAAGDGVTTGIDSDTGDETVTPGLTFTAPSTLLTGLSIGDLSGSAGSTHTRCFWIRQTVPVKVDKKELANTFKIAVWAGY